MQTNTPAASQALPPVKMLTSPQGRQLAYRMTEGHGPLVVYLPGYASDMMATKAQFLDQACERRGQAYLRMDYSGVGQSPGEFSDGTIGRWLEDALAVIDGATTGDIVLVGSSMGGWIGLHCAMKRPDRIKAFIGIAAAPDFTAVIWDNLTADEQSLCHQRGYHEKPTSLDNPLRLYKGFIEDGKNHLLLTGPIELSIPVVLLQGRLDREVPWETANRIKQAITPSFADVVFVEDGDHRLARPDDMEILDGEVRRLSALI